jgi:tetratricopeptide (TPR) repeat protein
VDRDDRTAREGIAEAWSLMARRDWSAALTCWRRIVDRFPDNPSGYAGAGAAFRESGQLEDAEELLGRAFLQFPTSSEVATNYGWVANARRDWHEAVRRWELVRQRYPESPSGYVGGGAALRELGRLDEAEAVLRSGMERLPHNIDIAVTRAGIASSRGDWTEALRRWDEVRSRFPDSASAVVGGAAALGKLGRLDEADRLLAEGVERCPARADIAVAFARLAEQRQDWPEAARRWQLVRLRFPDNPAAQPGLDAARQRSPAKEERLGSALAVDGNGHSPSTRPAREAAKPVARRSAQRIFGRMSSPY